MPERPAMISFLSDLGLADELVGVVKAVIADLAPQARVLDLTHEIPPFDVRAGSLALARAIQYVPSGVVLALVDPGVGTARRAVAVEVAGGEGILVGPDNGLLAPAVALTGGAGRTVVLTNPTFHLESPGRTFAGRDVFAPVAAHLCNGVDLAELGELIDPAGLLPGVVPLPREEGEALACEVLWVDRFGNAQLNVGPDEIAHLGEVVQVRIGSDVRTAHVVPTFGEIGAGRLGLVVDSYGLIALAVDRQSAAAEHGLAAGSAVTLAPVTDGGAEPVRVAVQLRPSPARPGA